VAAGLPLEMEKNPDAAKLALYINQLLDEVRSTPGVQDAAIASALRCRVGRRDAVLHGRQSGKSGWAADSKLSLPAIHGAAPSSESGALPRSARFCQFARVVVVNESFVKEYLHGRIRSASGSWWRRSLPRGTGC